MKRRFPILIGVMILLLLSANMVFAQQQTSAIQGTVTDQTGAALPGVTVEAVNTKGGHFTATTDSSGRYRFPSLPPGTYNVTGTLAGMEPAAAKNVEASLSESPRIDLKLGLSAVTETLTVTADAPLVDVTSSAAATSITSETFDKLPRGRDFSSIVTQAPSANQSNRAGGIMIDGASGAENRFIMDGVDTTNPQTGVQGKTLVTNFVDEVQVKSAGYAAEFGGATGGVINVITKTGTNDFRGSVGGAYNERSWGGAARPLLQTVINNTRAVEQFEPRKDDFTDFEPSVTLGGPILKDRMWFYGGYEPWIQSTSRTVDFLNSNGTVRTTRSFGNDFQRDNYVGSLSGALGSRFLYKATYNNSGYLDEGLLPAVTGRGSENSNYGIDTTFDNWTGSGYADFVLSPEWFFSAKGGRFYRNTHQDGVPDDVWIQFTSGSPSLYNVPANLVQPQGYNNIATNIATVKDSFQRDNLNFDVSFFPQFAGTHRFKAGIQLDNLKNEVFNGNQNYRVLAYWDQQCPFCSGTIGPFGSAAVYAIRTEGNVEQKTTGLFLQDSWTTMNDRLTLNLGVRTEKEQVPAYNFGSGVETTGKYAIEFGYEDKLAPRFGFSYDLFGNGRSKVFGSAGTFYDVTKLEMPRGSFGADKWIYWPMAITSTDWTQWDKCTNVTNNPTVTPTCPGMTLQGGGVNLRGTSNDPAMPLIDPNLKPMEQREISLGFQQELAPTMALGFRYINKKLIRAIEDVGVHVFLAGGSESEEFYIANPGEGVAQKILAASGCETCPAMPKAKRDYNGYEVEFTRRFAGNWGLHASYLYSTLKGNYSGLANSDEAAATGTARTSPNVNRTFDSLFMLFDQNGDQVEGVLGGDRPHQAKAQLTYAFPFGTTVGLNEYYSSGTPNTTEYRFQGAPFFANNRNDIGRTPNITQTDLQLQHDLRLGRFNVTLGAIVLNVFDEDKVTNVNPLYSTTSLLLRDLSGNCADKATNPTCIIGGASNTAARNTAQAKAFFAGFDAQAQLNKQLSLAAAPFNSVTYNQPNAYQDPREVRIFAKFTF
ncbi:MAG: carboxypeptidase regulatory-like domain-containing protein [Acidobacteriota bacterium]